MMMIQIDTQKSELYFLIKYLPPRFDHYTGTSTGSFLSMVSLKLWLSCKESACNAGDLGSIPGLERSPGGGRGNPLQYSCWRISWTAESGGYSPLGHIELDTIEATKQPQQHAGAVINCLFWNKFK